MGRTGGEFGEDEEKLGCWMSCAGWRGKLGWVDWEGGVVVQMEDDTNREVGPGEDGVCISRAINQHQGHDNDLFFFHLHINFSLKPQS